MILGPTWPQSGAPKVFTADDGRKETHEVHEFGILISDEGGATQVPHVEETDDPNVIKFAGRLFRAIPG